MQFLTPGFFDALIVIAIVIAVIAAGSRFYHDLRRGPRWPQGSEPNPLQNPPSDHVNQQEETVDD